VESTTDTKAGRSWLTPGVLGIGLASFLADAGHRIPTAILSSFLTATLGAPAAARGLIEGLADGAAGGARLWVAPWTAIRSGAGAWRPVAIS
jgi:hypothetical protein